MISKTALIIGDTKLKIGDTPCWLVTLFNDWQHPLYNERYPLDDWRHLSMTNDDPLLIGDTTLIIGDTPLMMGGTFSVIGDISGGLRSVLGIIPMSAKRFLSDQFSHLLTHFQSKLTPAAPTISYFHSHELQFKWSSTCYLLQNKFDITSS